MFTISFKCCASFGVLRCLLDSRDLQLLNSDKSLTVYTPAPNELVYIALSVPEVPDVLRVPGALPQRAAPVQPPGQALDADAVLLLLQQEGPQLRGGVAAPRLGAPRPHH